MRACNRQREAGSGTQAVMGDVQAGDFSCR